MFQTVSWCSEGKVTVFHVPDVTLGGMQGYSSNTRAFILYQHQLCKEVSTLFFSLIRALQNELLFLHASALLMSPSPYFLIRCHGKYTHQCLFAAKSVMNRSDLLIIVLVKYKTKLQYYLYSGVWPLVHFVVVILHDHTALYIDQWLLTNVRDQQITTSDKIFISNYFDN